MSADMMSYPMPPGFEIKTEIKEEFDGEPPPKKTRGRKKGSKNKKQTTITDTMPVRKKRDRFNGMPEEEVVKRVLPDHLTHDLDIVIVGINPGLCAAYVGHHYAGPGNHFWKCMYLSGLIPEPLTAYDDYKLLNYGIGFTNIVERTTRGSADLTRKEIKEGATILTEKLNKFKPKIAVFNGKGIYEVFVGHKNFAIGKQPDLLAGTETTVYVMPSSSARCSQLPRAVDKVPFYTALKKLRDYLRGDLKELDDSEVCFPDLELKVVKKEHKQEVKEEDGGSQTFDSCGMTNISQNNQTGYPPTNMHIKQEPGFNHGNMAYNSQQQNCSTSNQHSQYYPDQQNCSAGRNEIVPYQMMPHSRADNGQNFQMAQNSMGNNSFQMSQVMMQEQSPQNYQMYQGAMQAYNNGISGQALSFQQSIQINGISHQSSSQVMVQSSFQGQSSSYPPNMMGQGSYMNYPNQPQNFDQQNYNPNFQRSDYNNDVTYMGYSQGQGNQGQGHFNQTPFGMVKQEPKDFNEPQPSNCFNGQRPSSQSPQSCQQNMTFQGQHQGNFNQAPFPFVKQEPKDYSNLQPGSCCNGQPPSQSYQNMTSCQGQEPQGHSQNAMPTVQIKEEPRDFENLNNSPCHSIQNL